jgi:hypothetical protein
MPAQRAFAATLGGWQWVFRSDASNLFFYRAGMGTLDIAASVRTILRWTFIYAVLLGPPAAVALLAGKPEHRRRRLLGLLVYVVLLAAGAVRLRQLSIGDAARPLPVALLLLGAGVTLALVKRRRGSVERERLVRMLVLILFGLGFLAKMILAARVFHYGFALAMPATLVVIVALIDWLPKAIDRRGGRGASFRVLALAFLIAGVVLHLRMMHFWIAQKTHLVGRGRDAFYADERGPVVNEALNVIGRWLPPRASLSVFPEGKMINYLSRRTDPVPYGDLMPLMLTLFGENTMLAAFETHPPDFVAIVHKDTTEYGPRFFGHDYGQYLYAWVKRNYREVAVVGARPLRDARFGIALLERAHGPGNAR